VKEPIQSARERLDLPAIAPWRHLDARAGFEVLFLRHESDRYHRDGHATAVEEGEAWAIRYALVLDSSWATRSAQIVGRSALGEHESDSKTTGPAGGESTVSRCPTQRMHRRRSRGLSMHGTRSPSIG
jgi:hypothetical protein